MNVWLALSLDVGEPDLRGPNLLKGWAPHLISEGKPSHLMEETHFCPLHFRSHSVRTHSLWPWVRVGKKNLTINCQIFFYTQFSFHQKRPVSCPHHCRHQPARHSPLTCDQDPEILELLHTRRQLIPTQGGNSILFELRSVADGHTFFSSF